MNFMPTSYGAQSDAFKIAFTGFSFSDRHKRESLLEPFLTFGNCSTYEKHWEASLHGSTDSFLTMVSNSLRNSLGVVHQRRPNSTNTFRFVNAPQYYQKLEMRSVLNNIGIANRLLSEQQAGQIKVSITERLLSGGYFLVKAALLPVECS